MKQNIILKSLVLAALTFGATVARADNALPASGTMGLLGQAYAGLTYSHVDLDSSPVNADSYSFEYNQPLSAGLDAVLTYDFTQSGLVAGSRVNQQGLGGALRAFSVSHAWGKPYIEAGVGYAWTKFAGAKDNSFVWEGAVGVEFQAAPAVTVTPFVQYADAPDLAGSGTWTYGVKANYWVNSQWAVTAGIDRDDDQNTSFTIGTHFRF